MRYARKTDPATSHEAAASTPEYILSRIETYVLAIFLKGVDLTDEELITIMQNNGYPGTPSGIRTARKELAKIGKIVVAGYGKSKYGRTMQIWGIN